MGPREDVSNRQIKEWERVVQAFFRQEIASTTTLKSDGKKLFSEGNCMAEWLDKPHTYEIENNNTKHGPYTAYFVFNATQYSDLSPKHFSVLVSQLPEDKKDYGWLYVTKQPIGIQELCKNTENVMSYNIGFSDYSKRRIQPWDIWEEYKLNPWDADIVKRILRTKEEYGMTLKESRLMDYEKIIHICKKRIDQINKGIEV